MKNFISYYKWHLIFLLLIIICMTFMFVNMTTSTEPDLVIAYIGTNYVNVQTFNDNKPELELLLRDANDDDKKLASMYAYAADLQSDVEENLLEQVDAGDYDIYVTTKEALESLEDKSVFVTVNEYANLSTKDIETLEDESGRIYAASLMDNDYAKKLGIMDTTGLFIAVADADVEEGEELPGSRKNARNIAGYILGEE